MVRRLDEGEQVVNQLVDVVVEVVEQIVGENVDDGVIGIGDSLTDVLHAAPSAFLITVTVALGTCLDGGATAATAGGIFSSAISSSTNGTAFSIRASGFLICSKVRKQLAWNGVDGGRAADLETSSTLDRRRDRAEPRQKIRRHGLCRLETKLDVDVRVVCDLPHEVAERNGSVSFAGDNVDVVGQQMRRLVVFRSRLSTGSSSFSASRHLDGPLKVFQPQPTPRFIVVTNRAPLLGMGPCRTVSENQSFDFFGLKSDSSSIGS